jgi:hypothetical protein
MTEWLKGFCPDMRAQLAQLREEKDQILKHMDEVLDFSGSRCVVSIKENGEIGPNQAQV